MDSSLLGRGILCFERSTDPVHETTRTLLLRILKITEPVKCVIPGYDGHTPEPIEGDLVRVATYGYAAKPWSCDVDIASKSMESLKYLIVPRKKVH